MKDLYQNLQKYFDFERNDSVVRSIFQSLLLLVSGALLGLILSDLSVQPAKTNWANILLCASTTILYVYLEYRRLKREKNFPVSILQHLNASSDLEELKKQYNRKTKIDEYIDHSIQSLNNNTCPVNIPAEDFTICHQDLQAGLRNVLLNVVEKPHYVFDVDKSKFLVGTFLKEIYDPASKAGSVNTQERFFFFRDDLAVQQYFPPTLFHISNKAETFAIQTTIIESINLNKYVCRQISLQTKQYTLISSPIPNVCESCPPDGAIFCLYEGVEGCPADIENILLIFARIVSNWTSKFNDCVLREKLPMATKAHEHKANYIPPEVVDLMQQQAVKKTNTSN